MILKFLKLKYIWPIFPCLYILGLSVPTTSDFVEDETEDLEYLFHYKDKVYLISKTEEDAAIASDICESRGYELLTINDQDENEILKTHLETFENGDFWTDGKVTQMKQGDHVSYHIVWAHSPTKVTYRDFAKKKKHTKRDRRDVQKLMSDESQNCQFVQNGQSSFDCPGPQCPNTECGKHPSCSITLPPCKTHDVTCKQVKINCRVERGECSVSCPPCEVIPPQCHVIQGQCKVTNKHCTTTTRTCKPKYPPRCDTIRPNCTTVEKPCKTIKVPIPCPSSPKCTFLDPCTTTQPPCFTKDFTCITEHEPCYPIYDDIGRQVNNNCYKKTTTCPPPITTCPPPVTTCKPPIHCQPIACYSPAIVCEEPETHCPPPITRCDPTEWICDQPPINCPDPIVECPEPEVVCSQPQIICPGPNATCPGYITHCESPPQCPLPPVYCPPPEIVCKPPTTCPPVTHPPLTNPTCPTGFTDCTNCTTTPMPDSWGSGYESQIAYGGQYDHYNSYGVHDNTGRRRYRAHELQTKCVGLNQKKGYQWDHRNCTTPRRFICEASV